MYWSYEAALSTRSYFGVFQMRCLSDRVKTNNDRKIRKYDFGYDPVSLLTAAKFGQLTGSAFSNATVKYDVSNLTYDGNGNILTMYQYGLKASSSSATIDQLHYTYKTGSNKLSKVADLAASTAADHLGDFQDGTNSGDDYDYDGNGNMTSDQNKKIIGISYNILNLPSVITVAGKGAIKYYYDAAGDKLQKRTTDNTAGPHTTVTTYIGGAVYQNDTLQFFGTAEGRVRGNTAKTAWIYDYFLKDHLGNTRMMITDDYNISSPILEANSYYPFGLQQKGISVKSSFAGLQNKYLFNSGSELQSQEFSDGIGLDWYQAKTRMIDRQLGRFIQMDPMGDFSKNISPCVFGSNNPISINDPLGLADSLPVATVIGYIITLPVRNFVNWFNGKSAGYKGSGRGYGPRRWMADKIGMGNDANNLFELRMQSMLENSHVNLKGELLDKIKSDPAMIAFQKKIIAILKSNPNFGKIDFVLDQKINPVEFGGKRWSEGGEQWSALNNNNPLAHSETWAVAGNELTWAIRHANVAYTATVKSDGTAIISYHLTDRFDLTPGGRSPAYNAVTNVTGFMYHTIAGDNRNLKASADWQTTIK